MKTITLSLAALAVIFTLAFKNGTGGPQSLVVIRSVEKPNGTGMQKSVLAVYKDGVVGEEVELEDLNGKNIGNNLKLIGDVIMKYQSQGYVIAASNGAGATNSIVFNYVLEKK